MIYGYARVSTKGQEKGNSLEYQERELRSNGAEIVYVEAYTGTKKDRPELNKLLDSLKSGDLVLVTKLDRVARSTKDGIAIIDEILAKGCSIDILNMGKFDSSPTGKLMRTIFLAFAEFERDMIVMRTQEGKEIARQREGWREGRPSKDIPIEYREKVERGEMTVSAACKSLGISRTTWYR